MSTGPQQPHAADEPEVVDAEPVTGSDAARREAGAPERTVTVGAVTVPPRVAQAAALTLSGFTAGIITSFLRRRGGVRRRKRRGGKVVASRSFVIDVHMLDR